MLFFLHFCIFLFNRFLFFFCSDQAENPPDNWWNYLREFDKGSTLFNWLAPELLRKPKRFDEKVDVYGVSSLLWEMCNGK